MTDDKTQGGLPEDAGNGMSDRSGSTDESESGMTETSTGTAHVTGGQDAADTHTPGSGTTFGPTGNDDTRQ